MESIESPVADVPGAPMAQGESALSAPVDLDKATPVIRDHDVREIQCRPMLHERDSTIHEETLTPSASRSPLSPWSPVPVPTLRPRRLSVLCPPSKSIGVTQ